MHRLQDALQREKSSEHNTEIKTIYFKNDAMYHHNMLHINYTTYDVRRAQDTINPKTDHHDIMLLSTSDDGRPIHEYQYARVMGIYHVNLLYSDPTTYQYKMRHIDFLWVRYFELVRHATVQSGWSSATLDQLRFCRLDSESAFGFLDPDHVLRACHIIPRFSLGRRHPDGKGLSGLADDGYDWSMYYANRFAPSDNISAPYLILRIIDLWTATCLCDIIGV
jgi:hypothetical protein